jgi:hypothetical protein
MPVRLYHTGVSVCWLGRFVRSAFVCSGVQLWCNHQQVHFDLHRSVTTTPPYINVLGNMGWFDKCAVHEAWG